MRVALVVDHPYTLASSENEPHRRSFTAAVAAAAIRGLESAGHEVDVMDLVADGFDPVMRREDLLAWRSTSTADPLASDYQRRVLAADHLVFVFPIWWEAMPAATKGFLDKVLTKGVVFSEDPAAKGNPFTNLMTRLTGVSVLTIMTTPHAAYRWWFGNPVIKIMFKGTFGKIGVRNLSWTNFDRVAERSAAERETLLARTERTFARLAGPVGSSGRAPSRRFAGAR
ncbi:NAD(P)H-dependent oxidoreductase [Agromyces sp. Marseille-Q5079]|uniref:NAD(P)H-dependent oxidoreductase n=1 Tax=Agromyces sp. Marseille-Q5079 TaxID=3439059 RepID=UPI003D9CB0FD